MMINIKELKKGDSYYYNDKEYHLIENSMISFHNEWDTEIVTIKTNEVEFVIIPGYDVVYTKELGA